MSARLTSMRARDVVDTRCQQQMLAAGQLAVDRLHGVRRIGHEEVAERDRASRRKAGSPRDAAGVGLRRRDADVVGALPVDEQVRLLTADRRRGEGRVRRARKCRLRRRALDTCEDLVPDAVRPPADPTVANQPLLLRAVDHERQARVGDEAAARELRPGRAVVHQREVSAGDVEATHRHGLRDSPEVRGGATAVLPEGIDVQRQVGKRAPEVDEGETVARAPVVEAAVVDLDLAVDRDVPRRRTQTGELGVVAHLQLERLVGSAVDPRLEQERVTVRAHLGVDLLGMDRVDGCLDLADRHARVEDEHVRAKPSRRRCGARGRSTGTRTQQERDQNQRERKDRCRSNAQHEVLLVPLECSGHNGQPHHFDRPIRARTDASAFPRWLPRTVDL